MINFIPPILSPKILKLWTFEDEFSEIAAKSIVAISKRENLFPEYLRCDVFGKLVSAVTKSPTSANSVHVACALLSTPQISTEYTELVTKPDIAMLDFSAKYNGNPSSENVMTEFACGNYFAESQRNLNVSSNSVRSIIGLTLDEDEQNDPKRFICSSLWRQSWSLGRGPRNLL